MQKVLNSNSGNKNLLKKFLFGSMFVFITLTGFCQTSEVGGILPGNRTFYSDTTYIIVQDLVVNDLNTLTIQPGTRIRVNFGRSLIVDNGSLFCMGNESDSVHFKPNYTGPFQIWKWSGIIIKNSNYESPSRLDYTMIVNSETAIQIDNSVNTIIENSSIYNSQNIGVNIINSSFCSLINCYIEENYNGIEIYTTNGHATANNTINGCRLNNENHNIYSFVEQSGTYKNNLISENLITEGNNGIWLDNEGNSANSSNSITKNFIISNGRFVGYGIFMAMDSTTVSSNVFYDNNIAIFIESKGAYCNIVNNNFYYNTRTIEIGTNSPGNKITTNTFSVNPIELLGMKDVNQTVFGSNNIMNTDESSNIVLNYTAFDLDIFENYWGTDSIDIINRLIYDQQDDPQLGKLNYIPFSDSIITRNPISPPYKVIKQVVDNKVKVSFNPNREYDLNNYFIYFGSYKNYEFQNRINIGTDTAVFLTEDLSVYDEIAVTARDTSSIPTSMTNGNESPFAFADIYPYAGNDTLICKYVSAFSIDQSNIPYEYDEIFWMSGGDGVFNDPLILNPVYSPGIIDIQSGGVRLFLNVIANGDTLTDSFFLRIFNDPKAFAGNDTTVMADTSVYLDNAIAFNFTSVIWSTFGDGYFESDTVVNPYYFPGQQEVSQGYVELEMKVLSECGSATDTIVLYIEPHFSIEGRLWTDDLYNTSGKIIAYYTGKNIRGTRIESADESGHFRFPKVIKGHYYLYAVPDTINEYNSTPAYFPNKHKWFDSHQINVNADVYDVDITMPTLKYEMPQGNATVKGHVNLPLSTYYNSSVNCEPWFIQDQNSYCLAGFSNLSLFIETPDYSKILGYTLSDSLGNFYLNNLPYGIYRLTAEMAGYYTYASDIFELTEDYKVIEDVEVKFEDNKLLIEISGKSKNVVTIDIYPNPSSDIIKANLPDNISNIHIRIYDRSGIEVSDLIGEINIENNVLSLDISNLKSGIYYGKIISSEKSYPLKFFKK